MQFLLANYSSLSVLFPALIVLLRFRKTSPDYHPFFWVIAAGFLNETISLTRIYLGHNNIVNYNIHLLVESLLVIWQFKRWNLFAQQRRIFTVFSLVVSAFWLVDNFYLEGLTKSFCSYFIIFNSYFLVLLSITMVNKLIVEEHQPLYKNASFIVCCGFIIFFTYQVLVEIFYWYGVQQQAPVFANQVFKIFMYANVFVNLIFVFAILWMPNKQKFILRFS